MRGHQVPHVTYRVSYVNSRKTFDEKTNHVKVTTLRGFVKWELTKLEFGENQKWGCG